MNDDDDDDVQPNAASAAAQRFPSRFGGNSARRQYFIDGADWQLARVREVLELIVRNDFRMPPESDHARMNEKDVVTAIAEMLGIPML